jgi:hypothetical protein
LDLEIKPDDLFFEFGDFLCCGDAVLHVRKIIIAIPMSMVP